MTKIYRFLPLVVLVAALVLSARSLCAQDVETPNSRPLKCVYFSPSDCEPNPDRAERLFRVMKNVQDFYRKEMARNGFGDMTFALEEESPGNLKLYEVKAPEPQEAYGRDSWAKVRDAITPSLKENGIDRDREVVVIFQQGLRWDGDKATEVGSFVGLGTPFYGMAWFYDDPKLDPELLSSKEPGGYYHRPCSLGEFNSHYLGGIAHELGHALTLPHDCETSKERQTFGNALMGGGNHTYGNDLRGEGKGAFLTYSEALRLSVVPAISGKAPERRKPDVQLTELKFERVDKTVVRAKGRIEAERPILGLIFYNDPAARRDAYDAKTWTVLPDERGNFDVELTEIAPEAAELRVCAVRDIDTITLLKASYTPDGSENEFAPVTR